MENFSRNSFPPEVLIDILAHLGRSDLLNCRLVSRVWNDVCLDLLKNPKFSPQILTNERILRYTEFVAGSLASPTPAQLVLPFHLIYSVDIRVWPYAAGQPEAQIAAARVEAQLKKLIQSVKWLMAHFGPECINGFSCRSPCFPGIALIPLMELIVAISKGLVTLDLINLVLLQRPLHTGTGHPQSEREFSFVKRAAEYLRSRQVEFPKLQVLKSYSRRCAYDLGFRCQEHIHSAILRNAPNLKTFEVSHTFDACDWPVPWATLETLKIRDMDEPRELWRRFAIHSNNGSRFSLKELNFGLKFRQERHNGAFRKVLSFVSNTLNNLTLTFTCNEYANNLPNLTEFPRLPRLPALKNFKLKLRGTLASIGRFPIYQNPFNFVPEVLPALETVDIPAICDISEGRDHLGEVFEKVKRLRLRVGEYDERWLPDSDFGEFDFASYLRKLHELFPNVTQMDIVNECFQANDCGAKKPIKNLLIELMRSSLAPMVQEIEFQNFYRDYFGQALQQLDKRPRIVLENFDSDAVDTIKNVFKNLTGRSDVSVAEHDDLDFVGTGSIANVLIFEPFRMDRTAEHKMINIKEIRMVYRKLNVAQRRLSRQFPDKLNWPAMTTTRNFAHLRQIMISPSIVGAEQADISRNIDVIRAQFPNLAINLF